MPRSFRDVLKLSVSALVCAGLLAGCGSGGSGSVDLDQGATVTTPPPPVSKTESFDFKSTTDWFVSGTVPTHARFSGGTATDTGDGYWIIPEGATGVVEFGTPADIVKFSTQDNFTPTAASRAGAQKTGAGVPVPREAVRAPWDTPMYLRGAMNGWLDSGVTDQYKLVEVAENVKAVSVDIAAGNYDFKIASESYVNPPNTNCGRSGASGEVTIGVPYTLDCKDGSGNLNITLPKDAKWKFTLDVTGDPKVIVTEDTGGGGGGGEPEPEDDSTVIRVHYVTVVESRDGPAGVRTVETQKGLGSLSVDVSATGGAPRVYKVEIENLGTNGDIGIAQFAWSADARFALAKQKVDIFYTLPSGSVTGTTIVVEGRSYACVAPPPGSTSSCVARDVEVTPFANATMTVKNADGSTRDTIIFNGGSGEDDVFAYAGSTYASTGQPSAPVAILRSAAHWVNAGTLLYNPPAGTAKVELLSSPDASLEIGSSAFTGTFQTVTLSSTTNPQPAFNAQLNNLQAWSLGPSAANAKELVRGQLVAVARSATGAILDATYVQAAGAIEDLYAAAAYDEPLGVRYSSGVPSLAVWAPTALRNPGLSVNIYDAAGAKLESKAMTFDETTGIWSVTGTADWNRKFYTISLRVYSYASDAIVTNEATDPYSVSLATDSKYSQFVDLDDADLKPAGWDTLQQPALAAPEDSVLYELHVRDFSIVDGTVPAADRGKFTAFDIPGTAGRNHLQQLAEAGVTHVHLLPAFDIATVPENLDDRVDLDDPVERLCAKVAAAANLCVTDAGKTIRRAIEDAVASGWLDRPQQIVGWMRQIDGFNWGYDPYHFGVPEGSYSTDPNGAARILEFRRMVKGLNDLGLRTVLDVVYNHTSESGQNKRSVLDKIVPGYYYRRDAVSGNVTTGSCCQDTAAEFLMMEKLMIDTGVSWVRDYKVSGFRFDIMSMHPLGVMERFQAAVKAAEPTLYLYGEGWNCCGVENDGRFKAASQLNLQGTGIGSFSDRIRDPVRGGGPFDSGDAYVRNQGFVSGLWYDPNALNTGSTTERSALLRGADNIRVWLAGGLRTFQLQNAAGATVTGFAVDYNGAPSGYTVDPQEAVNYVEKHDNQTLWDLGAYKHPEATSLADRVRAQNVGLSLVLLGQGVPFVHAGSEILRSKSGDRDSYDSGDWFNELDWTLSGTKWAQGLPVDYKNENEWPILQGKYRVVPRPDNAAQQSAFDSVREMLRIRKSSGLFRLRDAASIQQRVKFYNTGPTQVPGVIAMGIEGCTNPGEPAPDRGAIMTIFNASDTAQTLPLLGGETWTLHPVLAASTDPVVRTAKHDANGFHVPARTTAVFERADQKSCSPFPVDMFVRGSFNDWGNDLATRPNYKLQFLGGTKYALSGAPVTLPASGLPKFKIADANWVAATNCGGTAADQTVRLGQPFTMKCGDGTPDVALGATVAGNYTFSLDAASTVNPVLTVTRTSPSKDLTAYVRGGFNSWGLSTPLTWDGEDAYTAVVTRTDAGATNFKIATEDWSTLDCGGATGGTSVTIGQPYALTCGPGTADIGVNFPAAGNYAFVVDASDQSALKVTVEPYVDVYVRGGFNGWGLDDKMLYRGKNRFRLDRAFSGATNFKIASEDWAAVDCGGSSGGQQVTIGSPFALACGAGTSDVGLPTGTGTYRFDFTHQRGTSTAEVLVTGP